MTDNTPLATIEQLDPTGVDIMAPSRYLPDASAVIRDGMTVRLIVQGQRPYSHAGTVFFIDNKVDPTTSGGRGWGSSSRRRSRRGCGCGCGCGRS